MPTAKRATPSECRAVYHGGIRAGELPLAARVLAIADVFEALTADRPYRAGMPVEQALGILNGDAGTAFCPEALSGFDAWLAHAGQDWALAALGGRRPRWPLGADAAEGSRPAAYTEKGLWRLLSPRSS